MTTNGIVKASGFKWKTVSLHLNKLLGRYVKKRILGQTRTYTRENHRIIATRQIEWTLLVKDQIISQSKENNSKTDKKINIRPREQH
jgi:hypothetical protein